MAVAGGTALLDLLAFMLDIVYCYLSAVLVIAFAIIVSPIIVPLAAFKITEKYVIRWLNTIIGAMLVPVLLFGFLSFTLDIFTTLVNNIKNEFWDQRRGVNIAQEVDFSNIWRNSEPMFSWVMPTDPNYTADLTATVNQQANNTELNPAVPSFISPSVSNGFNPNRFSGNTLNMPPDQVQRIIIGFISLWIYASVMKKLIAEMPNVAQGMAGAAMTLGITPQSFKDKMKQMTKDGVHNLGIGGGALTGGTLGAQAGQGAQLGGDGARGREIGAVGGMLAGGALGSRLATMIGQRLTPGD